MYTQADIRHPVSDEALLAHRTWVMPSSVAYFLELERRREQWSTPA